MDHYGKCWFPLYLNHVIVSQKEKITEPFDVFINIPGINNNIGPCLLMLCKTEQG